MQPYAKCFLQTVIIFTLASCQNFFEKAENSISLLEKYYDQFGNIIKTKTYINSEEYYMLTVYKGSIVESISFVKNDKLVHHYIEFYPNQIIKLEGDFDNDIKYGLWKYNHQNGNIFQIGYYENGFKTGLWKIYDNNGGLASKGEFVKGKKQGVWKTFYTNGNVKDSLNFYGGKLYGKNVRYFDNGEIMSFVNYDNGIKHGLWTKYDSTGSIIKSGQYEYGEQIGKWMKLNDKNESIYFDFDK